MRFLLTKDYYKFINKRVFDDVLNEAIALTGDTQESYILALESLSINEATTYIQHEYDAAATFNHYVAHVPANAYTEGDLVYDVGTDSFYTAVQDVPALTLLTDTAFWFVGDPRDEKAVQAVVDIVLYYLHGSVNPRNVPERIDIRYADMVKWLKDTGNPRMVTFASFPLKVQEENQGTDISWGSDTAFNSGENVY